MPPLYLRIVQTLQREIVSGLYPIGTKVPSESELCRRFDVSRHTVRQALRALRDADLVTSHQGLGTVVKRPGVEGGYVHRLNTIHDLFPADADTSYAPVEGRLVSLPEELPATAGAGSGQWLLVRATRSRSGEAMPFNEVDAYVAGRFAGVGRLIEGHRGAIHTLIETLYGESVDEVEQVFSAFQSDGVAGARVGLARGDIGIQVRRIYRLAGSGEVAMVSFNRYRTEGFSWSMTLKRQRA